MRKRQIKIIEEVSGISLFSGLICATMAILFAILNIPSFAIFYLVLDGIFMLTWIVAGTIARDRRRSERKKDEQRDFDKISQWKNSSYY